MQQQIEIAAGSVQGQTHKRRGQNNQDAVAWQYREAYAAEGAEGAEEGLSADPSQALGVSKPGQYEAIAVVCDGCGSSLFSEVGAQLGAKWVMKAIAERLDGEVTGPWSAGTHTALSDSRFWTGVQQEVLGHMRSLTVSLQDSTSKLDTIEADWSILQSYLLFTIIGAVITTETTVVFGLGDGVFAVNDDVQSIGPFANNAPPYLAYGLMPEGFTPFSPEELQFTLHRQLPTSEVRSLLIGSDGVADLRAIADQSLPNKNEPIGNLSQFWQDDRYFKNPDRIRRRLARINREYTQPDWTHQQLIKTGGLLPDDTTLVVMRRSEF